MAMILMCSVSSWMTNEVVVIIIVVVVAVIVVVIVIIIIITTTIIIVVVIIIVKIIVIIIVLIIVIIIAIIILETSTGTLRSQWASQLSLQFACRTTDDSSLIFFWMDLRQEVQVVAATQNWAKVVEGDGGKWWFVELERRENYGIVSNDTWNLSTSQHHSCLGENDHTLIVLQSIRILGRH